MKLKALVKLLMIKEKQPDLNLHVGNCEYFDLKIYDYLRYKDRTVLDWVYITGDALENKNDTIIVYIY